MLFFLAQAFLGIHLSTQVSVCQYTHDPALNPEAPAQSVYKEG